MDFNYFDFICFGEESFLVPLIGIILTPVLFPLYVVLKAIMILIEFLVDVFSSLFTSNKNKTKEEPQLVVKEETENVDYSKKEALAKEIERLKTEKNNIERQIRVKELENQTITNEQKYQEEQQDTTSMKLELR